MYIKGSNHSEFNDISHLHLFNTVTHKFLTRAEHRVPYKAYRQHHMYGTCTQASGILATFWLYPSEPLMDIICSRTLYGRIQAAYGEYGVRTLFFCLIGYFLLLTSQEPIQNPWNGVIHSIQDFSSNNSIAIILQEFYKPLMLSILVHFYLSNFGVVRLPSSINIQFWSFGWLGFPQWLIH